MRRRVVLRPPAVFSLFPFHLRYESNPCALAGGVFTYAELSDIDKVAESVSGFCTQAMGSHPGPGLFLYDPTPEGCERWTHSDIQLG